MLASEILVKLFDLFWRNVMKKTICLLACLFAGSANATLLTFDGAGSLTDQTAASYQGTGDTYAQDGYTLTVGGGDHFDSMTGSGLYWHDGAANANYDNFAFLTFSGGLFDLNSFDFNGYVGDLMTNLSASVMEFGTGSHSVSLSGLTWAAFSPRGNSSRGLRLDNVDVSAASAAVPEPSILALLGLGLAGIGFTRKKKVA